MAPAGAAGTREWRAHRRRADRRSHVRARPGDRLCAYHAHHATEEWLVVLRGRPTLRTLEGEQELADGDVVCFRRGKGGAHQVQNATESPIRVLMLSTLIQPDVVEYLNSGKVGARSADGKPLFLSRPGLLLDLWDGET
ncbi:MAG: cupin domain-containing protein [Actinomycetota bacterium]|nr:cupin domain-containing protein [Actinomycetota bacterium]